MYKKVGSTDICSTDCIDNAEKHQFYASKCWCKENYFYDKINKLCV